jgi:basic membrane lipoprotein Med (substrate-binding protein (PBP1-ABC) superfamily)
MLAACGGSSSPKSTDGKTPNSSSGKLKVYGAFATPIEEPWDGVVHQALEAVAKTGAIDYKYTDDIGYSGGMERQLRQIAEQEKPDLIVGDSYGNEEAVRKVAKEYPKIAFVFGSGEAPTDTVSVFDNWLHEPAYLAGMLAGGITKSNVIGVVGGYPVPEVNRIVNGFVKGAQSVNPAVQVKVTFINSWFDPAAAKEAALAQIDAGADVMFAERAGVIEAANEKGLLSIGNMADQQSIAPASVMTSLLWNMQPTIEHVVDLVSKGTYKGQDLAEWSFMKHGGSSMASLNTSVKGGLPDDLVNKVKAKEQEIKSGAFTVPVDDKQPAGSISVSK